MEKGQQIWYQDRNSKKLHCNTRKAVSGPGFIEKLAGITKVCKPSWSFVRAPNLHQCLWTCLQVCGSERLGCHADLYSHTRGDYEDHTSETACKGSTLALKPRANITGNPKQGYHWPHKKDLGPQNILKNNQKKNFNVHCEQ